MQKHKDTYAFSRFLYLIEAGLEYFISLLVTGAYLAKITSAIGINDTLTGILTAFVSLGSAFQMIAIFLANKRPVKRWVTVLHSVNQLAFALIYLVPFITLSKTAKTVLFIAFLLIGHIINNVVNSPKINWFMSLVDPKKRGSYTANLQIVSIIGQIIFALAASNMVDRFDEQGNLRGAFIALTVTILVLTVLTNLPLFLAREKHEVS
jgi:MFS family permease